MTYEAPQFFFKQHFKKSLDEDTNRAIKICSTIFPRPRKMQKVRKEQRQ